jgi:L-2-hydroxycarboxylate dehydrogenase (NAD+)
MDVRLPADRLEAFVAATLRAQGVRDDHAATTATRMIDADLRGRHGHGIFRLPPYSRRIREGGYNLDPDIRVERETAVTALVDGDNGFGHVVVTTAAELAITKAREHGLAWVGMRRSNHAGAGGVYAAMPLAHDMIGCYLAVANANHMPPWGGVESLLGTNPLAVAIPAGSEPPIQLDMATSVASYGEVKLAASKGEELPEGWMVDHDGEPLTDPARIAEGLLVPIGEHKGYGLNVVIGMLAGVLGGAAFGRDVVDFNADHTSPTNTGQAMLVLRADLFRPLEEFKAEVDRHIRELRASQPMHEGRPVRLPGERAAASAAEMREHGIPLSDELLGRLRTLAEELSVEDRLLPG